MPYLFIYVYIRRPPQSVECVRLQPSKSTMRFNFQAQAARQQPKQPRMTHACNSPGWMVQNLINYSSIGATASRKPGSIPGHRPSDLELPALPLGPQIDAPASTGVPNSSFGAPWLLQWSPSGTRALQQIPEVVKASKMLLKFVKNLPPGKQKDTHPSIQASKHPSIHSSGPRGRRQRR